MDKFHPDPEEKFKDRDDKDDPQQDWSGISQGKIEVFGKGRTHEFFITPG